MTMTLDGAEATAPLERDGLKYPFPARPEPGRTIGVAPGVHWIRLPLPFQLNHINVWALDDGDGIALVDTGINASAVQELWEQVWQSLGGRKVTRIFVTHLHPDHVGLAGWISERFGAPLLMSRTDYLLCRTLVMDTGQPAPEEGVAFYRAAGWSEASLDVYRKRFGGFGSGVYKLPQSYIRLVEGQEHVIGGRTWRVVVGRGHAPEHACLWCPEMKLMISGDQILPRISSNVSVFPTEPEGDPLTDWINSCRKLKGVIPEGVLVLPAHNEPFYGAHKRLDSLVEGHETALSRLLSRLDTPKRAVDLFGAVFARAISPDVLGMATGETLAHLNCLKRRGQVTSVRDGGTTLYRRAS